MRDIEKILENASNQEIQVPVKIHYRIQNTLKYKKQNKWKIGVKKLITALVSAIVVFIGSMSVYAAFGGTVSGIPVIEWLGIKFSSQYEEYKVDVEGQNVVHNETKIDLVSTVCDDGFTILEFDVALSKEDKEYLKLGEKAVTDEQLNKTKEEAEQEKKESQTNPQKLYESNKQFYYKELLKIKDYINTIYVTFDRDLITTNGTSAENIIIDNEGYYVISKQIAQKVSDYEYKVYQMYFLTEKEIGDKTDFNITVKINSIRNIVDLSNWKPKEKETILVHGQDGAREIDFNGEFTVKVSKNKALENTTKIIPDCDAATYKDMTKKVEEVKVTPLQIIVKVSTRIDNLSLQKLSSTMNKDYIGITNFDVYDNTGEKLISSDHEVRRTVTYSNGKVEEWSPGDIGTYKSFYNATMELTEYIIIEKKENIDSIKIVSTVEEPTRDDDGNYIEREVEFGQFNIDLR